MDIDIAPMLAPVGDSPPCGPNLEYDPDFGALEQAAQGSSSEGMVAADAAGTPADWRGAKALAEALALRTHDVRVAVYLARAWGHVDGLAGFLAGAKLVHGLLDQYWDDVHPLIEDGDPMMRVNAVHALADPELARTEVRGFVVARSGRAQPVTIRDILVATNRIPSADDETVRPLGEVHDVIAACARSDPDYAALIREPMAPVNAIAKLLIARVPDAPHLHLDIKPLRDLLAPVAEVVAAALAAGDAEAAEVAAAGDDGSGDVSPTGGAAPGRRAAAGEITDRASAIAMLERVCQFMERTEPTSPAPLLIRRAQRLMQMTFVEIIKDMAPDGFSSVQTITGITEEG